MESKSWYNVICSLSLEWAPWEHVRDDENHMANICGILGAISAGDKTRSLKCLGTYVHWVSMSFGSLIKTKTRRCPKWHFAGFNSRLFTEFRSQTWNPAVRGKFLTGVVVFSQPLSFCCFFCPFLSHHIVNQNNTSLVNVPAKFDLVVRART